jgi:hypothetical protein
VTVVTGSRALSVTAADPFEMAHTLIPGSL